MLKQLILYSFGGVVLTGILFATPTVDAAACGGYCAEKRITNGVEETYDGCAMYYNASGQLMNVSCYYVSSRAIPLDGGAVN